VKKETVITAIVFLAVGFLAGLIAYPQWKEYNQKRGPLTGSDHVHEPSAAGMPPSGAGGPGMNQSLPEGHPPIDTGAMIKTLEEQVAQNPKDTAVRVQLANAYYDGGQWQKAVEAYQKILELDPKNVSARTDMGTAYFNLGRPQDALKEYTKSLEIDPNHEPTIFNSIIVNMQGTRDVAAAQAAWDRLKKMNPTYPGLDGLKPRIDELRAAGASAGR
jgi:tetratricopeptide (TPR) repeat protein